MSEWIVPLFWGGAGALLAWLLIRVQLKNRACRRRDRELQVESARLGLSYEVDGLAVVDTFTPFVLLDRRPETSTRTARNLMQGEKRGVSVAVFDFDHHKKGGRSPGAGPSTRMQWSDVNTVVVLEDPARSWPSFSLRSIWAGPQAAWAAKATGLVRSLAMALGHGANVVDFESRPQFSSTYLLGGASEADVRRLFSDRVLSFFEENPGWSVEGSGSRLLIYRSPDFHPRKDWSFGATPGYIRTESVEQFLAAALDVQAVFA